MHVVVAILLSVSVAAAALSVAGMVVMRGALNRVHFLAPVSIFAGGGSAAAILVKNALNSRGIKALIVLAVLAGLNPVLAHAIARSAHRKYTAPQP